MTMVLELMSFRKPDGVQYVVILIPSAPCRLHSAPCRLHSMPCADHQHCCLIPIDNNHTLGHTILYIYTIHLCYHVFIYYPSL